MDQPSPDRGSPADTGITPPEDIPQLRFLRTLVTGLAVVMGAGMIAIVILLYLRLSAPVLPELPENIALPEGAEPAALTFARDVIIVVTEAGEVLVYDRAGALRQTLRP